MKGGRLRPWRLTLLVLPVLCAALFWPASSEAFVACSLSGGQLTVDLTSDDDTVEFQRFGPQIAVVAGYDAQILAPCSGGTPTVDNTDSVVVREAPDVEESEVSIDLSKGPFAPGATAEADGTSEIEFDLQMNGARDQIAYIEGTDAPESFQLGTTTSGASGVNVDAASESPATADADVTLSGLAGVAVFAEGGADLISGQGGPGFAAPLGSVFILGSGGPGPDQLIAPPSGAFLTGGGGRDRLLGSPRRDFLMGGGARDTILAGKGRDEVVSVDGKRDRLSCGASADRAEVDNRDKPKGCEDVRHLRVRHGRPPIGDLPIGVSSAASAGSGPRLLEALQGS